MRKRLVVLVLIAFALSHFISKAAGGVTLLYPNLQAMPATEVRIESSSGHKLLRFTTTSWNSGNGPLELIAGAVDPDLSKQLVYQRIYADGGARQDFLAGSFVWHSAHKHFHFEDYAEYRLRPVDGGSESYGAKVTFCVMDTDRVNTDLPGAPRRAVYTTCGNKKQGISVGWGDTYGYRLQGQSIDITGVADGDYYLIMVIDPLNRIQETNENDNTSQIRIHISGKRVRVIDGPAAAFAD